MLLLGRSVDGRPITAFEVGNPNGTTVLVVGCIHGNEPGGIAAVERRFARISGLPYHRLPALAGSAIDWQNHRLPGTTAFAAELPAGEPRRAAMTRYVRAVLAVAR